VCKQQQQQQQQPPAGAAVAWRRPRSGGWRWIEIFPATASKVARRSVRFQRGGYREWGNSRQRVDR
jgi:hypothetical protein